MPTFPSKLYSMLQLTDLEGRADIVSWQPHGRAFLVHKVEEFEEIILPRFFQHSKFSSIQRQLNIYDFRRIKSGHDQNAYYNQYFIRGDSEALSQIKRNPTKGNSRRIVSDSCVSPNFYQDGLIASSSTGAQVSNSLLLRNTSNSATESPEVITAQQTFASIQPQSAMDESLLRIQRRFSCMLPHSSLVNSDPNASTIEQPMTVPLRELILQLYHINDMGQHIHHNHEINIHNTLNLQPQVHEPALTIPPLVPLQAQHGLLHVINETDMIRRFRLQFLGMNQRPSSFEYGDVLRDDRSTAQLFSEGNIQNIFRNPYVANNIVPICSEYIDGERPIVPNWLFRRIHRHMNEVINNSYDPNSQSFDR